MTAGVILVVLWFSLCGGAVIALALFGHPVGDEDDYVPEEYDEDDLRA